MLVLEVLDLLFEAENERLDSISDVVYFVELVLVLFGFSFFLAHIIK